jgi:hypothetical protein
MQQEAEAFLEGAYWVPARTEAARLSLSSGLAVAIARSTSARSRLARAAAPNRDAAHPAPEHPRLEGAAVVALQQSLGAHGARLEADAA